MNFIEALKHEKDYHFESSSLNIKPIEILIILRWLLQFFYN